MKTAIAGGTGFLGSSLAASLRADGQQVLIVTRHPTGPDQIGWTSLSELDGADVVVNLAGTSLDSGRWNDARKASIVDSRVEATNAPVQALSQLQRRPAVFLNASAVGVYGTHGSEAITEEFPPGSDF